ncbi:amino acid adenylation domain-containing protein [Streptomyces sp. PTM05]|uniref:Amino acid adenylation domain-containing protein n=1 Tax=Streptantibioticus parmotrematis TaxID=2873249 RepID=A0ABS7QPN7_9ACTN|nr:non-ribosomal peptide synthetase [Streptantibioticus parmotrematis]MBY8885155.1 amino acid adenylation domain-containing protein [Streptantibioticus parmotrematis]
MAGERVSPLASAQQRLWFFWQLRPQGSEYNVPKATRLRGALDVAALEWAIGRLVERHDALRATFPVVDGGPVMRIAARAVVPLTLTDLTDLPATARPTAADEEVNRAALEPFDLAGGPVFRARLIRLAEDDHILLLAFHHIVVDGWSLGIVERELAALYAARRDAAPDPLPDPPHAYEDYVAAERRMLGGPRRAEALSYWRRQLTDAPAQLTMPTDRPHPPVADHTGDSAPFLASPQLGQEIQALARRHRVTRFVVLLGCYAALLSRLSSSEEVVVGVPVSGRTTLEVEDVVGLFVNMLPVRIRVAPDMTFGALLHHVRDTFLAGYEYQDLPFQQVVEELQPERLTSRHPVFQAAFTYEDTAAEGSVLPGLAASSVPLRTETAKFELTLHMAWGAGRVEGFTGYRADLFDARTAGLLGERYLRLLSASVAAPDTPVSALPVLGRREERALLSGGTRPPAPGAERVDRTVRRRAKDRPESVAVRQAGVELSYGELDRKAQALATVLRERGAGPERLVAVCLPRGADLAVAVLGVLRSGAAYVPLDPAHPPSRLNAILDEAGPLCTVTDSAHAPLVSGPVLNVDEAVTAAYATGHDAASGTIDALSDLAYVIYTSGSTGRPKGVMVEHRGLAHLVAWHHEEFGLGPEDRATMIAAPGFDASAWEIWSALTAGATLEVPDAETVLSPGDLTRWLAEHRVTSCFVPTPLIERMARAPWPDGAPHTVLTGGDRLRTPERRSWPFRLVNNYGPTESTVVATSGTVSSDGDGAAGLPDIGRPLPGVEVYILDTDLRPVPIGVPGELYLGGPQLARGYLTRPDLTADRFIPHPHTTTPGQRLYRTGDLARWNTNTTLDYLGRNDHQLKIRGFRIEPGEIENTLRDHPTIHDAITTTTTTTDQSEPTLTAYLVLAEGAAPPDREALNQHVGRHLPGYMRPHRYYVLPAFPLTTNGKVDRAALADGAVPLDAGTATGSAARSPMERTVAAVWARALGHDVFGVRDNFFDIGGHSMLLATVREHLARELDRPLAILTLFEHPTIESLAGHLTASDGDRTGSPTRAPAQGAGRPTPLTDGAPADDPAAKRLKRGNARLRAMRAQQRGAADPAGAASPIAEPLGTKD